MRYLNGVRVLATVAVLASCNSGEALTDTSGSNAGRIIFLSRSPGMSPAVAAVFAINPDGTGLVKLVDSVPVKSASALSPDGTKLAVSVSDFGLHSIDLLTGSVTPLVQNLLVGTVTWTGDSKRIGFGNNETIREVTSDGSNLSAGLADGFYPVFSSNGAWLIYETDGNAHLSDLHGFDRLLVDKPNTSEGGPPQFSPDTRSIAIVYTDVAQQLYSQLFVYDLAANALHQVTNLGYAVGAPLWSPDGVHIAFGAGGNLYVVRIDGTELVRLNGTTAVSKVGSWSPHGSRIAFIGNDDVYVVNTDGTGLRNLTNSAAVDFGAHWTAH